MMRLNLILFQCSLLMTNAIIRRTTLMTSTTTLRLQPIVPGKPNVPVTTSSSTQIIKTLKLPVWPVWNGVIIQVLEWLGLQPIADFLLSTVAGRVIPMQLTDLETSPFLLLVHHQHSFTPFDPFRTLTKFILPEGFPAHPHAGFDTVTYCLEGGLRHRDSEGFKMSYGDGQVQWMRAGRGIIHEEMWDVKDFKHQRIELFQLWVNLPQKRQNDPAAVHLLEKSDIPTFKIPQSKTRIASISGDIIYDESGISCSGTKGNSIAGSAVGIYHMFSDDANTAINFAVHGDNMSTVILYIRRGSVLLDSQEVRSGDLIVFKRGVTPSKDPISCHFVTGNYGFDGLLLSGADLKEPVILRGSLVDSDMLNLQKTSTIFNRIGSEGYWSYDLEDNSWLQHCKRLNLGEIIKQVKSLE